MEDAGSKNPDKSAKSCSAMADHQGSGMQITAGIVQIQPSQLISSARGRRCGSGHCINIPKRKAVLPRQPRAAPTEPSAAACGVPPAFAAAARASQLPDSRELQAAPLSSHGQQHCVEADLPRRNDSSRSPAPEIHDLHRGSGRAACDVVAAAAVAFAQIGAASRILGPSLTAPVEQAFVARCEFHRFRRVFSS